MQHPASPIREFDAATPRRLELALEDLAGGFARWRLAWALARGDITQRYRGSVLGPFWLTMSTGVMLTALGFLYSRLFNMALDNYMPWLAVSLIVWAMMSQIVTDATACLTGAEDVIRQVPLPFTVHALRVVFRNAVVAAHNLPLVGVVFIVFGVPATWTMALAVPGLLLISIAAFAAAIFLGMVCARFRDIPPIIGSVMQIIFFVSPVIWKPEMVGHWEPWLPINPFFALMETVRAPLMGATGSGPVWLLASLWTAALVGLAWVFFVRFRGRIAFWV